MKPRLKMDGFLLALVVGVFLCVYFFPQLFYPQNSYDEYLDFLGTLLILSGAFVRMSARGHKTWASPDGLGLAQDGLYAYTRNPMYLGTFTIGVGFVLIILPWWIAFIFAVLFYMRFRPLIAQEEQHLKNVFGEEYEQYSRRVPRFFPAILSLFKINFARECPWSEFWATKERRAIWTLSSIVLLAEIIKEWILFRSFPTISAFLPFLLAAIVFCIFLAIEYYLKDGKNSK